MPRKPPSFDAFATRVATSCSHCLNAAASPGAFWSSSAAASFSCSRAIARASSGFLPWIPSASPSRRPRAWRSRPPAPRRACPRRPSPSSPPRACPGEHLLQDADRRRSGRPPPRPSPGHQRALQQRGRLRLAAKSLFPATAHLRWRAGDGAGGSVKRGRSGTFTPPGSGAMTSGAGRGTVYRPFGPCRDRRRAEPARLPPRRTAARRTRLPWGRRGIRAGSARRIERGIAIPVDALADSVASACGDARRRLARRVGDGAVPTSGTRRAVASGKSRSGSPAAPDAASATGPRPIAAGAGRRARAAISAAAPRSSERVRDLRARANRSPAESSASISTPARDRSDGAPG